MGSVLYYFGALLFTVVYFVLFFILFLLTVLFDRERVVLHYASIGWARGLFGLNPCWKVRVEGKENIERGKAYVIVNNHLSSMDIPLMYVVPLTFKWVAKKEVLNWPVFGLVMRMHGDIAIERGTGAAARKMIAKGKRRLAAGTSVIVFPEGTRSRTGRVGRFHEGAFLLAKAAGAAVLPCAIEGTGSVMDGWKVRTPHTFTVRILPPVPAEQVEKMTAKELAERTHEVILKEHEEIRPDLYE
ncbi:MAG: 1-acyl-sn-glycerol-3-phosphate acyltransferase [Rikenellaceae bacterium]|jgi:1-acyl-sn-glycerol-3-phosphate acyltransferase|nr:1-acyl-sn-glycerol-3-phosphate acyltransferase [Rikenellaceae bacterium]